MTPKEKDKKSVFAKTEEDDTAAENWEDETTAVAETPEAEAEVAEDEEFEGQLTVDVYQTDKDIVVKSTIAGVKPDDIDVSINNDMLTIKGERKFEDKIKEDDYFYQECYWGSFSRSIILPVEVNADKITADIEDGILTIKMPKSQKARSRKIKVKSSKE